ncbi:MAG: hypothetical protein UV40_C0024G0017 [Parcubacteria group bacterium GW2011_GWA1_42_7]|nr:MAG: hypothetical protein UV34_C0023G0014 [Parcubacteria group bacterium GW2011_GWB1_42_6]KKS69415.1 MAG: hypothetical protein UV40_C0024G0017 [Parcubacteria group bacterium GW2011_GWA1_42_7]KKS91994.1 MAG: hypothetical protein UV67_C0013G0019 [Parcubacteria group bacterium GW2011_GWC1_43_12]
MKRLIPFIILLVVIIANGCGVYREIPSGNIAKVLTPDGFQEKIWESGMVDIGEEGTGGQKNILVLLEANSTTVKEQFLSADASPDKQDHRILTKNGTPLSVDLYIRGMVPTDENTRNSIFIQVTPAPTTDPRVRQITLREVYERFAAMDIRNRARDTFSRYEGHKEIMANYRAVNDSIVGAVIEIFKLNKVPINLQNVELSNIKPDKAIWEAENEKAAAESKVFAIERIGQALKQNPGYVDFMQWEAAQKIAEVGAQKGNNTVVIVGNGGGSFDAKTAAVASQMRR